MKLKKAGRKKILGIISAHSYGKTQESTEAKVLFDGDRLEYVNSERLEILLREFLNGKMPQDRFDYYTKAWNDRVHKVRKQLHFKYSQELFEERLKQFVKYASEYSELKAFTGDIVI